MARLRCDRISHTIDSVNDHSTVKQQLAWLRVHRVRFEPASNRMRELADACASTSSPS
jgi:hypothetical protein